MSVLDKTSAGGTAAKWTFLTVWLAITVFPLYWIVNTALKTPGSINSYPIQYWPKDFSFENFVSLFQDASFGVYMLNSLLAACVSAAVATTIAVLSGYVLARFQFTGRGAVTVGFLVTQMVPAFIALGPLYLMMTKLHLVNTRSGLILVYIAMLIPFSTIMLVGFFDNIPESLEEAAMTDGCSRVSALFRIVVPVMIPGIVAAFIFNFVAAWNELFLAVTLLNTNDKMTIPPALYGFITSYNIEWGPLSAAAVLTIIPTLIVFGFASKYIIQGLTAGSVKG